MSRSSRTTITNRSATGLSLGSSSDRTPILVGSPGEESSAATTQATATAVTPRRRAPIPTTRVTTLVDPAISTVELAQASAAPAPESKPAAKRPTSKTKRVVPLSERPMDEVWLEYRVAPTLEIRNFLIQKHLEIVRYTAERMHKRLPSEVDVDDLMSSGLFGLMDAIDAFDLDRKVKFETYCTQRIRGAIFDELRAMDWVPRLVRSRTAKVEKVRKTIEMETGQRPTDDEVSTRMNVAGEEFEKLQKDSRPVGIVSITRKCFDSDGSRDVREIDVIRDARAESPAFTVQKTDLQSLVTKGLSRAERLIVILYYYEEMTMKEIGQTLDLSESRVSQMHSSILARLKAQLQHREREF